MYFRSCLSSHDEGWFSRSLGNDNPEGRKSVYLYGEGTGQQVWMKDMQMKIPQTLLISVATRIVQDNDETGLEGFIDAP